LVTVALQALVSIFFLFQQKDFQPKRQIALHDRPCDQQRRGNNRRNQNQPKKRPHASPSILSIQAVAIRHFASGIGCASVMSCSSATVSAPLLSSASRRRVPSPWAAMKALSRA